MMNITEFITQALLQAQKYTDQITVIFLANVQGKTKNTQDYIGTSIETEFFSMDEYEELLISLQEFGFYTLTYFNCNEFIRDYYAHNFSKQTLLLFEGTQKGIGCAKDALIPSFCDLESLFHTGSNAFFNSICSNKYLWTKILEQHNLPVPFSWKYDANYGWLFNEKPCEKMLLIAKPIYECASIGITQESVDKWSLDYEKILYKKSIQYKQPFIVQQFIDGYEVEVPIIIQKKAPYILPPVVLTKGEEPCMGKRFLDFNNIFQDEYEFCLLKKINDTWVVAIENYIQQIVQLLELDGYARVDFRITNTGEFFITDINSYPHIVKHSSFAFAFHAAGFDKSLLAPCVIGSRLLEIF